MTLTGSSWSQATTTQVEADLWASVRIPSTNRSMRRWSAMARRQVQRRAALPGAHDLSRPLQPTSAAPEPPRSSSFCRRPELDRRPDLSFVSPLPRHSQAALRARAADRDETATERGADLLDCADGDLSRLEAAAPGGGRRRSGATADRPGRMGGAGCNQW